MDATKRRTIIKNRKLHLDLPQSFNNSEVEVHIFKIKELNKKRTEIDNFLSLSIIVDENISYPNREERNAR